MLVLEQLEFWLFGAAAVVLGHMAVVQNTLGALASVAFVGVMIGAGIYGYSIEGVRGALWCVGLAVCSGLLAMGNAKRILSK